MAYTKNYYMILGLAAPTPTCRTAPPAAKSQAASSTLRTAYRTALLAAHPDKAKAAAAAATPHAATPYTVDDVREAYTVLSSPVSRADYDRWLALQPAVLRGAGIGVGGASAGASAHGGGGMDSDFVLGLEVLDLSDFADEESSGDGAGDGEAEMLWTRPCRCGEERGFCIREEELVDAEARGETEVLVGCCGCSLWVRVAFEVEGDG